MKRRTLTRLFDGKGNLKPIINVTCPCPNCHNPLIELNLDNNEKYVPSRRVCEHYRFVDKSTQEIVWECE
jgi:hypothetical protein